MVKLVVMMVKLQEVQVVQPAVPVVIPATAEGTQGWMIRMVVILAEEALQILKILFHFLRQHPRGLCHQVAATPRHSLPVHELLPPDSLSQIVRGILLVSQIFPILSPTRSDFPRVHEHQVSDFHNHHFLSRCAAMESWNHPSSVITALPAHKTGLSPVRKMRIAGSV